MHSYADRGQKTFLISTLVDFAIGLRARPCQKTFLISTLVDIEIQYNYKSQKTFLISTLVDN